MKSLSDNKLWEDGQSADMDGGLTFDAYQWEETITACVELLFEHPSRLRQNECTQHFT